MRRLVVKMGGRLVPKALPTIIADLKPTLQGFEAIIVHGGGDTVTDITNKLGKKPKFVVSVRGFRSRYTDKEMAQIFEMVMAGKLNKEIVRALSKESINAVGLSGSDGRLLVAERKKAIRVVEKGKKMIIRGDYTGKIVTVNGELLDLLLKSGYTPVVAPVAIGSECEVLNVDADRAAAYVAGAVKADVFVLLTDVRGIIQEGKLIDKIKGKEEINEVMKRTGHGMKRKIFAALEALEMGVKRVIIASGLRAHPISTALALKGCTLLEL